MVVPPFHPSSPGALCHLPGCAPSPPVPPQGPNPIPAMSPAEIQHSQLCLLWNMPYSAVITAPSMTVPVPRAEAPLPPPPLRQGRRRPPRCCDSRQNITSCIGDALSNALSDALSDDLSDALSADLSDHKSGNNNPVLIRASGRVRPAGTRTMHRPSERPCVDRSTPPTRCMLSTSRENR